MRRMRSKSRRAYPNVNFQHIRVWFSEEALKEARTRRVVRANNFTQQTNVLDVDKHMWVQRA